jgi:hypothetical protein
MNGEIPGEKRRTFLAFGASMAGIGAIPLDIKRSPAEFVSVLDFGAVGDGLTDDTDAIQRALDTKRNVYFPVGRYLVTRTLRLPVVSGTIDYAGVLFGAGGGHISGQVRGKEIIGSVIVTPTQFAKPLWHVHSARFLAFRDMSWFGPGKGQPGSVAFHMDNLNRFCLFENIDIFNWETAFKVGGPTAQGNDSENFYTNLWIENTTYCYRTYNSQAYTNFFQSCTFGTNTDYLCKSESSGGYSGAMLKANGCFMGSGVSHFHELSSYGMVSVSACHFENGGPHDPPSLFYSSAGGTDASVAISVIGCQFLYNDARYDNTTIPFIKMAGSGPVTFIGNRVEHPNPIVEMAVHNSFFAGNHWRWQPWLRRPGGSNVPPAIVQVGETTVFYNRHKAHGADKPVDRKATQFCVFGVRTAWESAVPSTGSWRQGDLVVNTNVSDTSPIRWTCTSYPGGTFGELRAVTAATTEGSHEVALGNGLAVTAGEYIVIAGIRRVFQVLDISGSRALLDAPAPVSLVNAAVSYHRPTFKAERFSAVGKDVGNADAVLIFPSSEPTQVWNTPITQDRNIGLSTDGAMNGAKFRIVRSATCTGAFTLNVGAGPLKAMRVPGSFSLVEYDGHAWLLTGYGTL